DAEDTRVGATLGRTSRLTRTQWQLMALLPRSGDGQSAAARVFQTSIFSAISSASSTSTPRYRTVLSILVCPSNSWTASEVPRSPVGHVACDRPCHIG